MPRIIARKDTRWGLYIAIAKDPRTQFELAREMGRSNCWLSNVMHGLTDPCPEDRARIAEVLGVSEAELFAGAQFNSSGQRQEEDA